MPKPNAHNSAVGMFVSLLSENVFQSVLFIVEDAGSKASVIACANLWRFLDWNIQITGKPGGLSLRRFENFTNRLGSSLLIISLEVLFFILSQNSLP